MTDYVCFFLTPKQMFRLHQEHEVIVYVDSGYLGGHFLYDDDSDCFEFDERPCIAACPGMDAVECRIERVSTGTRGTVIPVTVRVKE